MNKVAPLECEQSAINIIHPPQIVTSLTPPTNETARVCKICLQEEITNLDILFRMPESEVKEMQMIVPCQCSGSVGYVHHKCILTWIQKQVSVSGRKEIHCEICKSQLYFRMKKQKYFDCSFDNLSLISGCNILGATIELFLLIVAILILRYSFGISESPMLRYVLIVLICILSLTLGLTILIMLGQAFVKSKKQVSRIFSIQQSEQLGLREIRIKTSSNLPKSIRRLPRTSRNFQDMHHLRVNVNNKVVNSHHLTTSHQHTQHFPFIEINPSTPGIHL